MHSCTHGINVCLAWSHNDNEMIASPGSCTTDVFINSIYDCSNALTEVPVFFGMNQKIKRNSYDEGSTTKPLYDYERLFTNSN